MFILIMAITALGFLIKSVLLPGRLAHGIYGARTELFFLGLNRHEWGRIHLIIGLLFVLLLGIHILLHWKLIGCIFKQMFKKPGTRWLIGAFAGIAPLLFLLAPFLITPEVKPLTPNYIHNKSLNQNLKNDTIPVLKEETPSHPSLPAKPENRRLRRGRGRGAGSGRS